MTLRAAAIVFAFALLIAVCVGAVLSSRAPDAPAEFTPQTAPEGPTIFEGEP